jgi:hypothetical protein
MTRDFSQIARDVVDGQITPIAVKGSRVLWTPSGGFYVLAAGSDTWVSAEDPMGADDTAVVNYGTDALLVTAQDPRGVATTLGVLHPVDYASELEG